MAIKTGLAAQMGLKAETTYGTAVTPDRFYYVDSFSIVPTIEKTRVRGLGSGIVDRTALQVTNVLSWTGKSTHTVFDKSFALLLKLCLGACTTTQVGGTTEYKHAITLDRTTAMQGLSATVQFGIPGTDGTVRAYTAEGGKVVGWELKCDDKGTLMLSIDWDFENCVTATALASASYASGWTPYVYSDIAWTIAGAAAFVRSWSIKGAPTFDTERRGQSQVQHLEPLWSGAYVVTFDLDCEFEDLDHHASIIAGTQQAFVMTATGDTIPSEANPFKIVATIAKADFVGDEPTVGGEGIVRQKLSGYMLYDGSAEPIEIDYHTTDTAA